MVKERYVPPELRVRQHIIPSLAHVREEHFGVFPDQAVGHLSNGDTNLHNSQWGELLIAGLFNIRCRFLVRW
jgi:hypothetical protein